MTDKETQLFILRHLDAGNTKFHMDNLTDVPEKLRQNKFANAMIAIINQGFLCPGHASTEKKLWNAYVSPLGKAFVRENTPEPLPQQIIRHSGRWLETILVAAVSGAIGTIVGILLTLYLTGKIG